MGRLFALGILGTITCATLAPATRAQATGSVTGTITTAARGLAPVRVTIDQKICGAELPDHAIVVDAQGRLANVVVVLTGMKKPPAADPTITNDKCAFAPRVQLARPNANVKTTSKEVNVSTYWRCTACGQIWNAGRLQRGGRAAGAFR